MFPFSVILIRHDFYVSFRWLKWKQHWMYIIWQKHAKDDPLKDKSEPSSPSPDKDKSKQEDPNDKDKQDDKDKDKNDSDDKDQDDK